MTRGAAIAWALTLTSGLAGCDLDGANPAGARTCFIAVKGGQFRSLDPEVANLETCAARLEVVYLRHPAPVEGRYGGVFVFITANSIDAAAPNGPRVRLLDSKSRATIDEDIRQLLKAAG